MKPTRLAILAAAIVAPLAACGGGNTATSSSAGSGNATCPTSGSSSASGAHLSIGSKGFAEEELLATITQLALQKHGYTVDYNLQAKDTAIGQAQVSGQIDMLWQYTGTELQEYLKLTGFPTDPNQAFSFVQQKDQARGLCWTSPAPMNDTNGIAIPQAMAGTYGDSLSAFGDYLKAHPQTKVCIMSEFRTRADGIPGLVKSYGAGYDTSNVAYIDIGSTAESNIKSGQCAAGEVFTTDSPIAADNLVVLKDDKNLFPPDNVGLIVRSSVLKAHPDIATIMAPIAQKITSDVITGLNKKVEIDNQSVQSVAQDWLSSNG